MSSLLNQPSHNKPKIKITEKIPIEQSTKTKTNLIPPPLKRESGSLEDITMFGAGGGVVGSFKLKGSSSGLEEEEQVKSMAMDDFEVVEMLGAVVEAVLATLEFVSFVFIVPFLVVESGLFQFLICFFQIWVVFLFVFDYFLPLFV